jgi:hypothetical protein
VFFSRSLDRCKILLWDRDRFVTWAQRFEHGRFQRPLHAADGLSIEIDTTTWNMPLGGADLKTGQRRQRYQRPRESSTQQTVSSAYHNLCYLMTIMAISSMS